ncbi:MAG: enoyl-CoA hydratase/isomerase family protein [Acidimicrobiia bacterium]|nr:enoyl-CoA hydratase/isomerase family protein [Acidimicrobiia bacterium]
MPDTSSYTGFDITTEDPGILVVTFNRPQTLNAATQPMKRDLVEVLTQAQMDDGVRVVVFTGTGTGFWAGDDLSDGYKDAPAGVMPRIFGGHHTPTGTYNGLRVLSQAVNVAVRNLDKLTIAAINGFAIQTGFSLALACDFRIAAKGARMGSATLRFGLLPDEGGQYLLVQHLGVAGAMDFLMRKRIVEAETAHELGLVGEVVEPDRLMPAALELARELADGPQMAMRMLKRSVYLAAEQTFAHALEDIAARTAVTDHLPDATEGMRAFREKRAAVFNQRLGEQGQGGHGQ